MKNRKNFKVLLFGIIAIVVALIVTSFYIYNNNFGHVSGSIEFCDFANTTLLDNTDIKKASAKKDADKNNWYVEVEFTDQGQKAFSKATEIISKSEEGKNYIAIFVDGILISQPSVSEKIDTESCIINGEFPKETAKELASLINGKSLFR